MKAKNYRDLLIEKHNLKEFICYDIPQKELELLIYRFLCENGLWIIMVGEVRHYTKKEISSDAEEYEYAYEDECIFINYVGK